MTDEWIIVPNWERFQHYKDRDPTWIKLYTELRNRDEWRHLTLAARGLLASIWIEYVAASGQLRPSDIPSLTLQKVPRKTFDSLIQAGFIVLSASKPVRLARARVLAAETEKEKETPLPPLKKTAEKHAEVLAAGHQLAASWNGNGDSVALNDALDRLEQEHHAKLTVLERDDLWDKAFAIAKPL